MSATSEGRVQRHDPTYMSGGGQSWAHCSCGWESGTGTSTFAQLAHGAHLLFVKRVAR